jgi:UDP-N-acetylglucosamine 2-epimerase (non-hydrolysing)
LKPKIICIAGTRPEIIKMAPVIRALQAVQALDVHFLSSGQHRELLVPLIDWFELRVDTDLKVMTHGQSLGELTGRLMPEFERVFKEQRPALVIAQGDTTTVLCAALTCFYLNTPFAHVEAGLRTFDVRNPFPEEFNRTTVARLAQLHFCPTAHARDNLLAERIDASTAHVTGNTVIDALRFTEAQLPPASARNDEQHILLTAHRRENFGQPLVEICGAVLAICEEFPRVRVLCPVHPNPNVCEVLIHHLGDHPQITLSPPLDYPQLVAAMLRSRLILTDSGGIQEEAAALCKPVLILRGVTERPEIVDLGVAQLVGTARDAIVNHTRQLLIDETHYADMARGALPYGHGDAAQKIRDIVCNALMH